MIRDCINCINTHKFNDYTTVCSITNLLVKDSINGISYKQNNAEACLYYNKDISKEKICVNCSYYLGGSDWGLSCSKNYYKISNGGCPACKDFKRRGKK